MPVQSEVTVEFKANPTQRAFIASRAKADYFSSRVREGKSAAISWCPLYHTQHNPGASWAIIRDTWENLQRTTLKEFFKWFPPGIFGTWHQQKKLWTWAEGVAKGEVYWFGMDDPNDAGKLQSLPLAGFGMDEVAPAAESGGIPEFVFDLAMTRLSQPGIKWFSAKLASNNPDETHWSYARFVDPGTEGYKIWQPLTPENEQNLPQGYYGDVRRALAHRPDLIARFVEGHFGFQQLGKAVTPQFNEKIHVATGLIPVRGPELVLCWDFGLNPTCLITQVTPLGHWNILEAYVGDDIGIEELISDIIKPVLTSRYPPNRGWRWRHIIDPAGKIREQTSSTRSPVRSLRTELGGVVRAGPIPIPERVEPARAVLSRTLGGIGLVQIDRQRAKPLWQALRGGWHFKESNIGVITPEPVKDAHSHPGDAFGYGAAILFPMGRLQKPKAGQRRPPTATFFGQGVPARIPRTIAPTGDDIGNSGVGDRRIFGATTMGGDGNRVNQWQRQPGY